MAYTNVFDYHQTAKIFDDLRDYSIWGVMKVAQAVTSFSYNTLKLQNQVDSNGYLKSRKRGPQRSPVVGSLYKMIENAVEKRIREKGDWMVIANGLTNTSLLASEVMALSNRFSAVLKSRGFQAGDKVHLVVNNNLYFHPLLLGFWKLGGVVSTGDTALDIDTINFQISEIDAKIVVCDHETSEKVKKAIGHQVGVTLFSIDCSVEGCEDIVTLARNFPETSSQLEAIPDSVNISPSDPSEVCSCILWSSGTTGRPKGIMHSHQSSWNWLQFSTPPLPLHYFMTMHFFHVNGVYHPFTCLLSGAKATFAHGRSFTLEKALLCMKETKPSMVLLGSHHYVQLSEFNIDKSQVFPHELKSVKGIVPLGAAVPSSCRDNLRKIFPLALFIVEGYGQTEAGVMVTGFQENPGLGEIVPWCVMKIVNPDTREICKPLEHGEICAKSEVAMMGYLNQPRSTYFDEEGFGMTGDIGYYDTNGKIEYVDRVKELIKYCNNHVAPTELEDILQSHPLVEDCLVFGIKEPSVQELISAVVVVKEGATLNEGDIKNFVNNRVNVDFKKIRGRVLFRDSVPRNTMGKLLRREMRKWAEQQAESENKN